MWYMIKITGCLCIIVSSVMLGQNLASGGKKRLDFLHEFLSMITIISGALMNPSVKFYEIFEELSDKEASLEFTTFYERMKRALEKKEGHAFEKIWSDQVNHSFSTQHADDVKIAKEYASVVGCDEFETRISLHEAFVTSIQEKSEQIKKESKDKDVLYRALGIGLGIILVIILF